MIDFEKLSKDQLDIANKIVAEAQRQGVDPNLMLAIGFSESGFKHTDGKKINTSPAGAIGVLQLMPGTAKSLKIDPRNLDENIRGGVTLMKQNLDAYGNPLDATIAYNTSVDARNKYFETRDLSVLPTETIGYVEKINNLHPLEPFVPEAKKMAAEGRTTQPVEDVGVLDPNTAALVGGTAGLITGTASKYAKLPTDAKYNQAVEKANIARDRLKQIQERIAQQGNLPDLEAEFKRTQTAYAQAEKELADATERLKSVTAKQAPSVVEEVPGRKVPGSSGAANWARKMADEIPDVIAESATSMRKADVTGAQALIDRDVAARQKLYQMGLGDYQLSGRGETQLALPKDVAEARNLSYEQELARRQAAQAQAEAAEAAQARAQVQQARQSRMAAGEARRGASQAMSQARRGAMDATKAQERLAVAEQAIERAPKPGTLARAGEATARIAPRALGVLSGAATGYTLADALNEWNNAYDTWKQTGQFPPLEAPIVRTLEAGFGVMSMLPPYSPLTAGLRAIGMAGGLGMMGYEGLKAATQ